MEQFGELSKGSLVVFSEASFQEQKKTTEQTNFAALSTIYPAEGPELVVLKLDKDKSSDLGY